jgi:hypothetical protein
VRTHGCQMNVHDSERIAGRSTRRATPRSRTARSRTSSCSAPAPCARTPTTSSPATSATSSRSSTAPSVHSVRGDTRSHTREPGNGVQRWLSLATDDTQRPVNPGPPSTEAPFFGRPSSRGTNGNWCIRHSTRASRTAGCVAETGRAIRTAWSPATEVDSILPTSGRQRQFGYSSFRQLRARRVDASAACTARSGSSRPPKRGCPLCSTTGARRGGSH